MAIIIEAKDRERIADISVQPLEKQIVSATKMAKLITKVDKAERRWMAAVEKFGSDDVITGIFRHRVHILRGGAWGEEPEAAKAEAKVKAPVEPQVNRIQRRKEDFPIGCVVKKFGEDIAGLVTSHEGFLDYIWARFTDKEEPICIYDIKRA
jgi:hypothetical protein